MLVGPPGVLKTTLLDVLDDHYHNALSVSNSFMQTMKKLQSSFYNKQIRSMCFPDLQSIYAGDPRTSNRIEQMMMQLSGEATRTIGGEQDARYAKFKGYCTMFTAMTDSFFNEHVGKWEESGFLRRFLWSTYTLYQPDILMDAIENWQRAELGYFLIPTIPLTGAITETLEQHERHTIRALLRHQPGPHELQFQVLCKATMALKWHYRNNGIKKKALETVQLFSRTLGKDAALIVLPEQKFRTAAL